MDDQFTEWHSVRPWQPTLSLSVREITSVSVTFILSSPYSASDPANPEPSLVSLNLSSSSDDDDQSPDSASTTTIDTTQTQVVSDILVKGLSVKVNGTPWQRVILKMHDTLDESIIILFGLMPGRQYDVELGIKPGEATVRRQVMTNTEARTETAFPDTLPDESAASSPETSSVPLSSSPPHANGGAHSPIAQTPPSAPTLEDRRQQLSQTLSLLTTEHSSLTSALKSARRESQKADAALRSEIDILKRASDRHAAGEGRARKKVLALQEAVKQTVAAARDIEALVQDIKGALPALEMSKAEVEQEWRKVQDEAKRVRMRREEAEQHEKARAEAMQAELAGLVNRLEKLNGKRDRLEGDGGVLGELEEKLRKLEEERERVERDPYGYEGDAAADSEDSGPRASGSGSKVGSSDGDKNAPRTDAQHPEAPNPHHFIVHPRKRHPHPHIQHPHPHTRSSFPPRSIAHQHQHRQQDPIHRPQLARGSFPAQPHAPTVPGVIHLQSHHRTANGHHGRGPFRAQSHASSGSSSTSSATTAPTSTLSSRAPPFEPGRVNTHPQSHQAQNPTSQASVAAKSELNPGSTPFAPRAATVPGAVGSSVPGRGA